MTVKTKYHDKLPEFCFATLPVEGLTVIIKRGESGYARSEKFNRSADELNAEMSVTKQQAAAMLHGSMFSWNIPAANPANFDEDGQLKPVSEFEK